jgi:acyl-CoA thioester hydrolase
MELTGGPFVAGHIEGGVHYLPLRIYYQDTDAGGICYHARYFDFAERGRMEMLHQLAMQPEKLAQEESMAFVLRHADIDWLAPARLADHVTVASRVTHLGGASLKFRQDILKGDGRRDPVLLASLRLSLVCVDTRTLAARRMPEMLRAALQPYLFDETPTSAPQGAMAPAPSGEL